MERLSELTTLRLGGEPARMVEARTEGELAELVRSAYEPLLVLAGGSNVVVSDSGFPGTVVRVLTRGVRRDGERLEVQAGEPWDELVAMTVEQGLQGFECLSGIPGSTGATPIQNVGAYGQEVAETVESVRVLDRASGQIVELPAADCGFTYRASIFKHRDRHVVLAVTFRMRESAVLRPAALRRARAHAGRVRRRQRAAGGGARGGARAAPRQGDGDRPRRPRLGQRGLVLHQPDPRPRRLRAPAGAHGRRRQPARVPGAGRPDQDARPPG